MKDHVVDPGHDLDEDQDQEEVHDRDLERDPILVDDHLDVLGQGKDPDPEGGLDQESVQDHILVKEDLGMFCIICSIGCYLKGIYVNICNTVTKHVFNWTLKQDSVRKLL